MNTEIGGQPAAKRDTQPNQEQDPNGGMKSPYLREMEEIKNMMVKRTEERAMAVYFFTIENPRQALSCGRELLFASEKTWETFQEGKEYKHEFQQKFFIRYSKSLANLEYILDCLLMCKIYSRFNKKDDIISLLQKVRFPEVPSLNFTKPKTRQEMIEFNERQEIKSKTCALLLKFIQISKGEKFTQFAIKLWKDYLAFVEKYYGAIELGTALFMYANYYYESKSYQQALAQYDLCIQIRKRNIFNGALIDALINSALCLKSLNRQGLAIPRVKQSIQIHMGIVEPEERIDDYNLLLAKLYMENGDFKKAYNQYLMVYCKRQDLDISSPRRIEIELNILFFFKTLTAVKNTPATMISFEFEASREDKSKEAEEVADTIEEKLLKRKGFAKYQEFKESQMAHLELNISDELFNLLTSDQVRELSKLLQRFQELNYIRGMNELIRSQFYKTTKLREILLASNPSIKKPNKRGT